GDGRRPDLAANAGSHAAPGPGTDLLEVPAEGAARPLRHGGGTGRRPGSVPRAPAGERPPDSRAATYLSLGLSPADRGGAHRCRRAGVPDRPVVVLLESGPPRHAACGRRGSGEVGSGGAAIP